MEYFNRVQAAAAFLRERFVLTPEVGLLTGTGLGESAENMDIYHVIPYADVPHFPRSTVAGHLGRMLCGQKGSCTVLALQGRFHLYEGYSALEVTFPIRVMQVLGVKTLVLTNASGGLNPEFRDGDIMIISDHINLSGENPLVGPNLDQWGPRFPDMSWAYDTELAAAAARAGADLALPVKKGVYAGLKGPSLETPAEVRFLQSIGAEAVGFSTVLETIAGVHGGMRVLGLATITNVHNPDRPVPGSVDDIIEVARSAAPKVEAVIHRVLAKPA